MIELSLIALIVAGILDTLWHVGTVVLGCMIYNRLKNKEKSK